MSNDVTTPPPRRKPGSKRLRNCVQFLLDDEQYIKLLEHSKPEDLSKYCRELILDDMDAGALACRLAHRVESMTDDERLQILRVVSANFCAHCGRVVREDEPPCQCWNDE